MKRQVIFFGMVAFVILALTSISATLAAPKNAPLLQIINEGEPNDSPETAQSVDPLPVQIAGEITQDGATVDTDYFSFDTQAGIEYQADLSIQTVDGMRLQLRALDFNQALLGTSSSSDSSIQFSWESTGGTNYIQVRKNDVPSATLDTNYVLEINQKAGPTPTPVPDPWDAYEPNSSLITYSNVSIGGTIEDLNFWPYDVPADGDLSTEDDDIDVFRVWCKQGDTCRAETAVTYGVDTLVKVFNDDVTDPNTDPIVENDDYGSTLGSRVTWESSLDGNGYYKIWVENLDGSPRQTTGQTYELSLINLAATPSPTPGPTQSPAPGPTPRGQADECEDNSEFDRACVLPVNVSKTFNFVPPYKGTDNDFYKIWVKPNLHFKCATSDLDPGIDPNMIVFNAPSWDNAIGGNDDIEPGNYNCAFSYFSTYEGWLYILVGTGDRTPADIYNSDYTLICEMWAPGEATSTPGPTRTPQPDKDEPTFTPTPREEEATPTPTTPSSPVATPTESRNLSIRPLTTPTPVPENTPDAPRFIPIKLLAYYDDNGDGQAGAGEGISGISAHAYEVATNQLLAQGFTDEQGNLEFTVAAQGPVRVSVPFLGFSQLVTGDGGSIYLRVPPQAMPEGTP